MEKYPWNTGAVVIVIVNDMVDPQQWEEPKQWEERHQWQERQDWHGWLEWDEWVQISWVAKSLCTCCQSVDFLLDISRADISECRARDGEVLTGRSTHTHMFLVARRVAQLFYLFTFRPMHVHWLKASWFKSACESGERNIVLAPQSFLHLMSCRNLLGLPDRRPTFADRLETELGKTCDDPRSGGSFGRLTEQFPLTGYEPNNLIEISREHTPINFPSRRNSFSTDFNDVRVWCPRHLGVGMTYPLSAPVRQQAAASGSSNPQQPASPNVINPWQTSNVGSCGKLQRIAHMLKKSILKGERDREFGSVSSQEQETFLSERENLQSCSSTSRAPTQTDGRKPYTFRSPRGVSPSGLKAKDRVHFPQRNVRRTVVWLLDKCNFLPTESVGQPCRSQRKVAQKDRCLLLTETVLWGCVSQDSPQRKSILWENGKWGSNSTVKFSRPRCLA